MKERDVTAAIEIENLSVRFGDNQVLRDVNLTLPADGFLGLIGPNGAGKSVLLKTIAGLIRPSSGQVRIFGLPPHQARGTIGYVPQFGAFDRDFPATVLEVVLMGRLARAARFKPYSRGDRKAALTALERVGLKDLARSEAGRLSGGQLQRVLIARALAVEPKILLLDEPTASLDAPVGRTFYELLEELAHDAAVLLVSHDVGVIAQHVKTIACLNRELYYHESKEISGEILQKIYGCPVDLIAHGHAHRVLSTHPEKSEGEK